LAAKGVSCRVGIQPLHQEPYYRDRCAAVDLPVTEDAARTTLFLPIYPGMTEAQQDYVVASLKAVLAAMRSASFIAR